MKWYYEENYGADADGNRGEPRWFYEVEESDEPWILDGIMDIAEECGYVPSTIELVTLRPDGEDVEIEVDCSLYKHLENRFEVFDGDEKVAEGLSQEEADETLEMFPNGVVKYNKKEKEML